MKASSIFAITAAASLSACATVSHSPFPQRINVNQTDPATCNIVRIKGWQPGFLISFGTQRGDNTKFDRDCETGRIAAAMIAVDNLRFRAIGVAAYDSLPENEKVKVHTALAARGIDIEKIRESLPRVSATETDAECIRVAYTVPSDPRQALAISCVTPKP